MTSLAILVAFPAFMAFAAASDLVTMTISNRVSLALVASFIVLALALGLPLAAIGWHFGIALVVLAVTFGLFAAGWIGGGDAKLAAATALWIGPGVIMEYLLIASVFGGLLTLAILEVRRRPMPMFAVAWPWFTKLHNEKSGVPYGIALAASGLIVYPSTQIWQVAFGA